MTEDIEGTRYLNIKITENSLKEIGCPSVPKDIIKNITLEYGKISERPIWQLNTGIIIALIGLYPVWRLINLTGYRVSSSSHYILVRHEGASYQRVKVPPGKLTVHPGSYPDSGIEQSFR